MIVALLIAGASAAVVSGAREDGVGFAGPQSDADSKTYVDVEAGFRLTYPASWTTRDGERVQFFPAGTIAEDEPLARHEVCVNCGGAMIYEGPECPNECEGTVIQFPHVVYVSVLAWTPPVSEEVCATPEPDSGPVCTHTDSFGGPGTIAHQDEPLVEKAGAEVTVTETVIAGRPVRRVRTAFPARPPEIGPQDEWMGVYGPHSWCSSCEVFRFTIDWRDQWTILVTMTVPQGSSEEHRAAGLALVNSLEPA